MIRRFDVVVLGAGPAGEVLAQRLAVAGWAVAVVEAELVGGECAFWACMPSKALLRSAHALNAARRLPGAREAVTANLDVAAVLAHRDRLIAHLDDSEQARSLEESGVTIIRGWGRLVGERRVVVTASDTEPLVVEVAVAVVIATGSTAAVPPIPGLAAAEPWTSREVATASAVPRRLVIIGGGVVGVEMAQAWKSLGSEQVVVLVRDPTLFGRLEPFVGERLLAEFEAGGIEVRLGADVVAVERARAGAEYVIHLADGQQVVADELVVATGRQPATGDIGLDTVDVKAGTYIEVDDTMRVDGRDWLYAVGDVNGRALVTHQGKYQARVAADAIMARHRGEEPPYAAEADHVAVPQVIFTDPEVATVGCTSAQAVERGLRVRTVEFDLGQTAAGALHAQAYEGRAALVIDEDAQVVVGATFVGQDVAELLHAATIAVVARVPVERLRHAVPSFPTLSEVWLSMLTDYGH